ncbi:MAG: PQQ-binding-like beta-propeller repeat protein, partial [Lentisphaeria bacterium]|nr:PQQ-binding-like beta-propeller repeat protein [Lentisphaeria bacterium]
GDRLFVVSDDGHLYCLGAGDGALYWRLRGGPTDSRVLGNGRLISRWPARGGPVVADGVVYFAAGIWPSEGIFLYAVDMASGHVLWCNDRSGHIWMAQPHPGANASSGVSAQGVLVLAGDRLLVPTGRGVPAVFDRRTGELLHFHLQAYGHLGGADIVAAGDWFFNGNAVFGLQDGQRNPHVPGLPVALTAAYGDRIVQRGAADLQVLRWEQKETADRKGNPLTATVLTPDRIFSSSCRAACLIVAGQTAVSGGSLAAGYGIEVLDLESGAAREYLVAGEPLGLAAADARLFVATAGGQLVCFGSAGEAPPSVPSAAGADEAPAFDSPGFHEAYAEEVVRHTGVQAGYCFDLGCGDGALAYALAQRTALRICAFDSDPATVARARRNLDAAGVYGSRVTVQVAENSLASLPDCLADMVVSSAAARGLAPAYREADMQRLARPWGGVVCVGRPGALTVTRRGPLPGAGSWTHPYADPTNRNCSDDTLVQGPLGVLWFTDFAFPMPSRHGRGRPPLFLDGRLFIQGLDALLCVNAYNGSKLWEYPLPGIQKAYDGEHLMGTSGTGGNVCVGPHGLYIHTGEECHRLDPASGEGLARFPAPPQPDGRPGTWGIVAIEGDTLFGTLADTRHLVTYRYQKGDMSQQFTESIGLFAMDAITGALRWLHQPRQSMRHNAIAIGNGRIHLIDRAPALGDRERETRRGIPDPEDVHPTGRLVTLDAASGRILWESDEEIYGTTLVLSPEHEILLMCYQDWRFKLASERGGRMAAFRAGTGERCWDIEASYQTRPVLNGRTIYLQPGAWDLLTGERTDFTFQRSYGCGIAAGSTHILLFRSATLGYVDLVHPRGTENYGGIRPGCWINAIPAGGLVLMPDATDRCGCSYLNKASIALCPYGLRPPAIAPDGACRGAPFDVSLASEREDGSIHYTTDGTAPTLRSPLYGEPLTVRDRMRLRARVFVPGLPPSREAAAEFRVDPHLIAMDAPGWAVVDSPGGQPPRGDWRVAGDVVREHSNLYVGVAGDADPTVDRPGTYRVYSPGHTWADGECTFEISSSDNDGLGVAFRFGGADNHYLWSMDAQRSFHVLGRRRDGAFEVLARNGAAYEPKRWYEIRVVLDGPRLSVYVDGTKDLEAVDDSFATGAIALYAWG